MAYCSRECQVAHRATHKDDCGSWLASSNWAPAWACEGRSPSFVTGDPGCGTTKPAASSPVALLPVLPLTLANKCCALHALALQLYGRQCGPIPTRRCITCHQLFCRSSMASRLLHHAALRQFLWGNTPAFSLVPKPQGGGTAAGAAGGSGSAAANVAGSAAGGCGGGSGESSSGGSGATAAASPLSTPEAHLCFAASGDLRNVIATVNGIDAGHEVSNASLLGPLDVQLAHISLYSQSAAVVSKLTVAPRVPANNASLPPSQMCALQGLVVLHVNDLDPTTMARNFVMLLLLAQASRRGACGCWHAERAAPAQLRSTALVSAGARCAACEASHPCTCSNTFQGKMQLQICPCIMLHVSFCRRAQLPRTL